MKRTLTILLTVLFIAGIVFAKDSKPETVSMKLKYKKNKPVTCTNYIKFFQEVDGKEHNSKYEWKYDLTPLDVKSGFLEKAKIKQKEFWIYFDGVVNTNIPNETPEDSDEFTVENNFIKNYLRDVPDKNTPKIAYRFLIALSYVYLVKEKFEVGKGADIPKDVINGLEYVLNLEYKTDLKYKMRIKEEIDRKKPVFGVERGYVIEIALSWRDGDNGVESRGLAVWDSKEKMIAGVKSHGWIRHKVATKSDLLKFELEWKSDPPGNFKSSDNPKPAAYPKPPEPKANDESSDLPTAFKVGEDAPAFTLEDLDGDDVSLSDYKGKVVLIHTWATTIPKIDDAMLKVYKGIYEKWSSDKLVIISVGIGYKGDTKEKQKEYVEKNDIKWVTLWDKDKAVTNKYQLKNQFYVALVSAEGKVVNWGYLGDKEKDAEMSKYLQENCSK